MKLLYTTLTGLLFVLFSVNSTSSTFTLNCSNATVDNVSSNVFSIIDIQENAIVWTQQTTTATAMSFDISSSTGSWDESTSTGQMNYTLTQDGYQADFSVTGTSSGITAAFVFHITDSQQETYSFTVNSITY